MTLFTVTTNGMGVIFAYDDRGRELARLDVNERLGFQDANGAPSIEAMKALMSRTMTSMNRQPSARETVRPRRM